MFDVSLFFTEEYNKCITYTLTVSIIIYLDGKFA